MQLVNDEIVGLIAYETLKKEFDPVLIFLRSGQL
jgi:hypothetical protein